MNISRKLSAKLLEFRCPKCEYSSYKSNEMKFHLTNCQPLSKIDEKLEAVKIIKFVKPKSNFNLYKIREDFEVVEKIKFVKTCFEKCLPLEFT